MSSPWSGLPTPDAAGDSRSKDRCDTVLHFGRAHISSAPHHHRDAARS
jgi:hypothetical protein